MTPVFLIKILAIDRTGWEGKGQTENGMWLRPGPAGAALSPQQFCGVLCLHRVQPSEPSASAPELLVVTPCSQHRHVI